MSYVKMAKAALSDIRRNGELLNLDMFAPTSVPDCQVLSDQLYIAAEELLRQLKFWAGNDPKKWEHIHSTLIQIYTPNWNVIDARDIIIAWTAANVARTHSVAELGRLQNLQRPLSQRETNSKKARKSDISFWTRLVDHLGNNVAHALVLDSKATTAFFQLLKGGKQNS